MPEKIITTTKFKGNSTTRFCDMIKYLLAIGTKLKICLLL